jgi:D-glycero-alpha-D-manno-heptose-7-phosphate kinase
MQRVVSKTPVRFSLAAGGTDLDAYWLSGFVGATVSLTIDKFVRVIVKSALKWHFSNPSQLAKAAVKHLGLEHPISISVKTDLPAGTGLGTGGAIMVGLVKAISCFMGEDWDAQRIAETAYQIERHDLGLSCGKKDQYMAAFGGLNLIEYYPNGSVVVTPLVSKVDVSRLCQHLLLFDTGITRDSEGILHKQQEISQKDILPALHLLNQGAYAIVDALRAGNFQVVGEMMNRHWLIKRDIIPGISNEIIDNAYERAIKAGALGGRISGAGGGGYLIIFCPPEKRELICQNIGLQCQEFEFESEGTRIIETE